jgi:hypothetical protein
VPQIENLGRESDKKLLMNRRQQYCALLRERVKSEKLLVPLAPRFSIWATRCSAVAEARTTE